MRISVEEASELLLKGSVVAIPTDTVYGLAAKMEYPKAVDAIFTLKKRPSNNPLIILVGGMEQVTDFLPQVPEGFIELTRAFWPGALTLVVDVFQEKVPSLVRAGGGTCGFRHQGHLLTQKILEKVGPVVAPSANLSGGPSATCFEHVEHDFGKDFPVVDGGVCDKGVESTILAFQGGFWKLIRQGAILKDSLEDVLGYSIESGVALAAGLPKYTPKAKLVLGKLYTGQEPFVLGFSDRVYSGAKEVLVWGASDDPAAMVKGFHNILRQLDLKKIDRVWVDMAFNPTPEQQVIFNWLQKLGNA